jgi:DNA-binding response OmpR family regulator
MVVDDDKDTCQLLHAILGDEYDILEAHDGITAIELAIRYKPDLFIIDGMLPRMSGAQLTLMLKKNRDFCKTPIVFISGKASQRDQEHVKNLGVTQFVAKPFTPQQILGAVHGITRQPDFVIHKDRINMRQVALENFTHLEAHRKTTETPSLSEMEQQALTNRLKQQLS